MNFQEEQNKLLSSFFKRHESKSNSVEFIISSICNQKCEYCYLYKHGKEMYPPESNKKENILTNLPLLLDWLHANGLNRYTTYDIFSGEFFALPYWEDIFKIFYDWHLKNLGHRTHRDIVIPCNGSFVLDNEKTQRVEAWIKKFKTIEIGTFLSFSIDGPEPIELIERPNRNSKLDMKTPEFYDRLFTFAKQHSYGFHPMVTKNFVKNYKENYDWWVDQTLKYGVTFIRKDGQETLNVPMFLEVRDNEQWDTDEAIENYKKFLWYMAERDLETFYENNTFELAMRILNDFPGDDQPKLSKYTEVQPYILSLPTLQQGMPCSIQNGPVFRVGDLAYVPCHRTCYPLNVYGWLEKNEDGTALTGFKANNPTLAVKVKTLNTNRSFLKCSSCPIKPFCMKGCLGSQLEHNHEMFSPEENVCKLFIEKFKTIHEICEHYKLYDIVLDHPKVLKARKDLICYARDTITRL